MKKIDLHIHTTASDGTFTPEEVVQEALRAGLAAVAITDHDTAVGYPRAAEEGLRCGVEVVPGIEISTKFRSAVHILGYYIDTASPALEEVLDWMHRDRDERNVKLCAKLRESGVDMEDITFENIRMDVTRPFKICLSTAQSMRSTRRKPKSACRNSCAVITMNRRPLNSGRKYSFNTVNT